jgi:type VI secretion system protein ImpL
MRWVKIGLILLGLVAWTAAVLVAGPLIAFGQDGAIQPFAPWWVQALLIGVPVLIVGLWGGISLWRRWQGQRALEQALLADAPPGDGEVLAERMQQALLTLKRANKGGSYLYDLPWYIIVGPPGSGKTTALLNADIKFPLAERTGQAGAAMQGFGGTRYCDWWFAEEAVLIDTAGRYTTQDSDSTADAASWKSFLALLKKNRPRQPINGVMLAFSVSDLMNAPPETVASHAATVRARLAEIHETLKVDFPVYVIFTKADLIAGFREYFASFSLARRRKVWGATFQTEDRRQPTHDQAAEEFDALLARLSTEMMDRLSEEHDGASRIAIFGLPGQMALLKDPITAFLRQVFEPTRYRSNAILRGFYFTSGTQEGTPIDQVLGEMGRSFGTDPLAMMSGRGRSYFLNELLTKVIFAEQGWVSYDRAAVRRAAVLRWGGAGAMLTAAAVLGTGWGFSYFANRDLIGAVQASTEAVQQSAGADLATAEISDTDLSRIALHLNQLRQMPTGLDDPGADAADWSERFGLGQRAELRRASEYSYRHALERLFRPRLILSVEQRLTDLMRAGPGNEVAAYETLKAYKLIGRYQDPPTNDDLIKAWFATDWRELAYPQDEALQADLQRHLAALLEYDDEVDLQLALSQTLIDRAEAALAAVPVEERAWSLILAGARNAEGIPDIVLLDRLGSDGARVFETRDGNDMSGLVIPRLYTRAGFHDYFLPGLAEVGKALTEDQWVLGAKAVDADTDRQLSVLGPALMARYRQEFKTTWDGVLANLRLAPMSADRPQYAVLTAAASSTTSPILKLVETVAYETLLSQPPGAEDVASAAGNAADVASTQMQAEAERRLSTLTTGFAQIGLNAVVAAGKSMAKPGGGGPAIVGADIASDFEAYQLLAQGAPGARLIDQLIAQLNSLQGILVASARATQGQGAQALDQQIGELASTASKLPPALQTVVTDIVTEFESDALTGLVAELNDALKAEVVPRCETVVEGRYPFAADPQRPVPLADFAEVFRPGGLLDGFFAARLAEHVDISATPWAWKAGSPLAEKLSTTSLRQFERAARVRDAFFPGRSPTLGVQVTFAAVLPKGTRQVLLSADGTVLQFDSRQATASLTWPGSGSGYRLDVNGESEGMVFQGPWAILQMLQYGQPRRNGAGVQVAYQIGKRAFAFDVSVASLENPFLLRDLQDFSCPKGL